MSIPTRILSPTSFSFGPTRRARAAAGMLSLLAAIALSACGGGAEADGPITEPLQFGDASSDATPGPAIDAPTATPSFHLANVLPPEPSEVDADGSHRSALLAPSQAALRGDLADLPTAGTSGVDLRRRVLSAPRDGSATSAAPLAGSAASATYYTPAQIRMAYGLDKLPAASAANLGAYQGSGQTIVIVGAFHNASVADDLAVFSQRFGLGACQNLSIASNTALPLPKPAPGSGCSFSVVYATATGAMTSKVPAGNAGWATETALDVQWAHAMAPQARIILVEAASPGGNDLLGAVTLAGKLGSVIVSMSWGAAEFNGQTTLDRYFTAPGVTYLAASGDSGRGVSWPAVSPNVLAVGGTKLSASGGLRAESAWSLSGGGLSAYTPAPAWQSTVKVTSAAGARITPTMRAVPDVAFNADPNTGQLVYSSSVGGWIVAGGTSIGAPQWAGLLAITNAARALDGKAALNGVSNLMYRNVGGVSANYASALLDVTSGSNGSCVGCGAMSGYDQITGLGTPNADKAVDLLARL